jgi:hypothetical protein
MLRRRILQEEEERFQLTVYGDDEDSLPETGGEVIPVILLILAYPLALLEDLKLRFQCLLQYYL